MPFSLFVINLVNIAFHFFLKVNGYVDRVHRTEFSCSHVADVWHITVNFFQILAEWFWEPFSHRTCDGTVWVGPGGVSSILSPWPTSQSTPLNHGHLPVSQTSSSLFHYLSSVVVHRIVWLTVNVQWLCEACVQHCDTLHWPHAAEKGGKCS